mgnify:CR=1 FL=1
MDYTIEEFDKAKTKIMNYIMYKKRTEYEVKNKFSKTLEENLLHDIIEYVKEAGYLSDTMYIERAIAEYKALNNLSRKEISYKLYSKGISKNLIEDYFSEHQEELYDYELQSAKNILDKKSTSMETEDIKNYLRRKGYRENSIKEAIERD